MANAQPVDAHAPALPRIVRLQVSLLSRVADRYPTGSVLTVVLTPDEVAPVMSELLRQGLRVTALHNHLLRSTPMTFYMHVRGEGDPAKLAASLRAALALSHTPLGPPKQAAQPAIDLDTAAIDRIIGRAGKPSGGVYQFMVPRREQITEGGMAQPASMGISPVTCADISEHR